MSKLQKICEDDTKILVLSYNKKDLLKEPKRYSMAVAALWIQKQLLDLVLGMINLKRKEKLMFLIKQVLTLIYEKIMKDLCRV
jgi:hypothetical protein